MRFWQFFNLAIVRWAIQNVKLIWFCNFYRVILYRSVEAIRDRMGYTLFCHNEYIVKNVNARKPYENERKLVESLNEMLICFCTFTVNSVDQSLSYYSKFIYLTTIITCDI